MIWHIRVHYEIGNADLSIFILTRRLQDLSLWHDSAFLRCEGKMRLAICICKYEQLTSLSRSMS